MKPLLFVGGLAALLSCAGCGGEINCVWEGPVSYEVQTPVRIDDSNVGLTGTLTWQPCGGDRESTTRSFVIDAITGETRRIDTLPAGAPLDRDGSGRFTVDLGAHERRVLLFDSVSDSVTASTLTIGEIHALSSDSVVAMVKIDATHD